MDRTEWLLQELEKARARVQMAQRELTEAEQRVKELEIALKWLRLAASAAGSATGEIVLPVGELAGRSQVEAAAEVLRKAGRPLPLKQVVDEMLAMGFQYDKGRAILEKSLRGTLSRLVAEKKIFSREDRGLYSLLEWKEARGDPLRPEETTKQDSVTA